tara:strand:- start:1334 stop:2467 length:1134 start_codon:yes stop_codon:yes gene_type:complete
MTVVNPKSISGITSITTASGSDNLLTIHTSDANNTERLRIDSTGATKIVTGIVTTLTATTGIVTTLTTNTLTANSTTKVGTGITLSPDGDIFATGISTFGTGHASNPNADGGQVEIGGTLTQFKVHAGSHIGVSTFVFGDTQVGSATTSIAHFDISNKVNTGLGIAQDDDSNVSYITRRDNGGDLGFILRHGVQNRERVRIMSGGRVGIGSTIPRTALDVNGVITGDGSGLTAVNTPSFSARVTTTQSLAFETEATIIFDTEDHDTDNAYNTSTGEFTVPSGKGGVYHVSANFGIDDPGELGDIVRLRVFKNGSLMSGFRGQVQQGKINIILTTSVSGSVTLAAGDVIKCMAYTSSNVGDANIEVDCTYFSMFRLSI